MEQNKVIIMINGKPIVLKGFNVICKNGLCEFAHKYQRDTAGNKICLYWFDDKTSGKLLNGFFKSCRKNKIIPVDIVCYVQDVIKEQEAFEIGGDLKNEDGKIDN